MSVLPTFAACSTEGVYLLSGIPADSVNSVLLQLREQGCHIAGWGLFTPHLGAATLAVLELQPSFAQVFDLAGQFPAPTCNPPLVFNQEGVLIQGSVLNTLKASASIACTVHKEQWLFQGQFCSISRLKY